MEKLILPSSPFRDIDVYFKRSKDILDGYTVDEEESAWIPYEPRTANRFLMFDLARNAFAVVLRCEPGSGIAAHYHTGAVVGYSLSGTWKYKEYDWIAKPGTFILEPAGEAHTLVVVGDEPMVSFFHVMGPHIQLDETGKQVGYVDAFSLLDFCRTYYREHGLDPAGLEKIVRR